MKCTVEVNWTEKRVPFHIVNGEYEMEVVIEI